MKTYVKEIVDDLYLLRIDDYETRYFEALWSIPEGITYNAYLLKAGDKHILFDTWKHTYSEEFIEELRKIVDPREIDYLVIHHMEQDHSGTIPRILEFSGDRVEVIGHRLVENMLESFYGVRPRFRGVADGEEIVVGGERLVFFHAPWLHWPETIITYIPSKGVLLTGDVFGGFSIPRGVFDDDEANLPRYLNYTRKYIIDVIGHYSEYIVRNIEKLAKQNISPRIIAPAHGLIFRRDLNLIQEFYVKTARGEAEKGKVTVIYGSMYGAVEKAVKAAVEELSKAGMKPVIHEFTDKNASNIGDILADVINSEAVVIGASTYESDINPNISHVIDMMIWKVKTVKPVLVISSYGWGGVAGTKISRRLEEAGFRIVEKIEFRGSPTEGDLDDIKKGVRELLKAIAKQ